MSFTLLNIVIPLKRAVFMTEGLLIIEVSRLTGIDYDMFHVLISVKTCGRVESSG